MDQGQTLFADGTAAYEALPDDLKELADNLEGLHVMPGAGRSEQAVRAGETPDPLKPHEQPQRQPVVRVHPVTGKRELSFMSPERERALGAQEAEKVSAQIGLVDDPGFFDSPGDAGDGGVW